MQLESGVEKFYLISFLNKRNRIIELGLSPALTLPISFFFVPGQKNVLWSWYATEPGCCDFGRIQSFRPKSAELNRTQNDLMRCRYLMNKPIIRWDMG